MSANAIASGAPGRLVFRATSACPYMCRAICSARSMPSAGTAVATAVTIAAAGAA